MPLKQGQSEAFFLKSGVPVKIRLGSQVVQDSPSAPEIASAVTTGGPEEVSVIINNPVSNGGSPLKSYRAYANGELVATRTLGGLLPTAWVFSYQGATAGDQMEVSAVNAIGEGPKSSPFTVT